MTPEETVHFLLVFYTGLSKVQMLIMPALHLKPAPGAVGSSARNDKGYILNREGKKDAFKHYAMNSQQTLAQFFESWAFKVGYVYFPGEFLPGPLSLSLSSSSSWTGAEVLLLAPFS